MEAEFHFHVLKNFPCRQLLNLIFPSHKMELSCSKIRYPAHARVVPFPVNRTLRVFSCFLLRNNTLKPVNCLYLYFEIKRLPRHPHLSPLQHEIDPCLSSLLLYRAFLAKEGNLMHRNILLRVIYLLHRAATHLSGIFHDRERYNQITWLERNKGS